jgi:hypothetical protein
MHPDPQLAAIRTCDELIGNGNLRRPLRNDRADHGARFARLGAALRRRLGAGGVGLSRPQCVTHQPGHDWVKGTVQRGRNIAA